MAAHDILIVLIIFSALFGTIYVIITARNRERMAMIEKEVSPKDFHQRVKSNSYAILNWGMLLGGLGFGLFIANLLETYTAVEEVPAYFAGSLFFGGIGLLIAFLIQRKSEQRS